MLSMAVLPIDGQMLTFPLREKAVTTWKASWAWAMNTYMGVGSALVKISTDVSESRPVQMHAG